MSDDPYDVRRTGTRRLRTVTAAVGAAALLGTGALTWALAEGSTTAAAATTTDSSGEAATSDAATTDSTPTVESDDSGSADASSGGS